MDIHGRFTLAQGTAAVFRHGNARVFNLPFPGLPPELGCQFVGLGQTGGADGMAAGNEPA